MRFGSRTRSEGAYLVAEELAWHGITSDVDPGTGVVVYSRGGATLSPGTIVGHLPAPDVVPAPPGTFPGARPMLLPAGSGPRARSALSPGAAGVRTERAKRMVETHRRRQALASYVSTAESQWADAIIAADPMWGSDEDWELLIDQTTTDAPTPPPPSSGPCIEETPQLATIETPELDADAELAALEADLQDLYRP